MVRIVLSHSYFAIPGRYNDRTKLTTEGGFLLSKTAWTLTKQQQQQQQQRQKNNGPSTKNNRVFSRSVLNFLGSRKLIVTDDSEDSSIEHRHYTVAN
ncbi:hypothetical protein GWI33_020964 [Rhynchophorus ferrugineus]|uniref:Uncharacterized protein n=1 Tax=Rhynchophorus ferrugineus TaxID=354439 RepID=A0A834LZ04_RHYFE|nr:hypothetical protein GWI33_020964 [Rhynchophorus ferrugineus]